MTARELRALPREEQQRILLEESKRIQQAARENEEHEAEAWRIRKGHRSKEAMSFCLGLLEARLFDNTNGKAALVKDLCKRIWRENDNDQRHPHRLNRLQRLKAEVNAKLEGKRDPRRVFRVAKGMLATVTPEELPALREKELLNQKKKSKTPALPPANQELDDLTMKLIAGMSPKNRAKLLRERAAKAKAKKAENTFRQAPKKPVPRGKRAADPPIEACKALLRKLIEQGITGAKETARICCKQHRFSRYAYLAARHELNLIPVRRGGIGKAGRWELLPG
jgi:hypothetical protein